MDKNTHNCYLQYFSGISHLRLHIQTEFVLKQISILTMPFLKSIFPSKSHVYPTILYMVLQVPIHWVLTGTMPSALDGEGSSRGWVTPHVWCWNVSPTPTAPPLHMLMSGTCSWSRDKKISISNFLMGDSWFFQLCKVTFETTSHIPLQLRKTHGKSALKQWVTGNGKYIW